MVVDWQLERLNATLTVNELALQANAPAYVVRLHDYRRGMDRCKKQPAPEHKKLFSNHILKLEGEQYEYNR